MKTDLNKNLTLFLKIADNLIDEKKITSYREFSRKYLKRSENYIGTLVYQNKSPSIITGFTLYHRLLSVNKLNSLKNELHNLIYTQFREKIR